MGDVVSRHSKQDPSAPHPSLCFVVLFWVVTCCFVAWPTNSGGRAECRGGVEGRGQGQRAGGSEHSGPDQE